LTVNVCRLTLNEQEDFISTLYDQLQQQDIPVEMIRTESTFGQLALILTYSNNAVQLADDLVFANKEAVAACVDC
jgi:glutamine synthetase